ncbi:MAG: LysR substrate-binding domain-containing protein [Nocardioidaceae bacterium]
MERALSDAGARPRIVFRSPGNETILSMVRAGMGSAVLPWLALHGSDAWSDDRLRIHELRPVLARGIYLHWPAGSAQSHWRHGRSRSPSRSQLTLQSSPSRRPQHRSVTPWES